MAGHIDHYFDDALIALKQQIKLMGAKVEQMVSESVQALKEQDVALAQRVVDSDRSIDAMEMSVDEQCIELLARYQPAATDLRFITRGFKIVTDLERIGDLAVNCAERIKDIIKENSASVLDISKMTQAVQEMLKASIESFIESDASKAESVISRDDEVDAYTKKYVLELIDSSTKETGGFKRLFPLTSFVRYLERIADHSTNIAELTIFMARGRDVRHGKSV